jgi:ligand-binding sensor domain-containing protein
MLLRDSLLICCIAVFSMQWGWSQAIEASESESTIFDHLNPRIKQFTLQDGLSQVSANDLIHDKNGVVWIATQDGLNRFDGTEFNHYKYSDSDSNTVSGNLINKLLEDRGGGIWVGTIGNGLSYYEPHTRCFSPHITPTCVGLE